MELQENKLGILYQNIETVDNDHKYLVTNQKIDQNLIIEPVGKNQFKILLIYRNKQISLSESISKEYIFRIAYYLDLKIVF